MCIYSMISDWVHKYYPYEWDPNHPFPHAPNPFDTPATPVFPWTRPQLDELEDILKRVKDLEERAGVCPCPEEGKQDFLDQIRKRLDEIERRKPR